MGAKNSAAGTHVPPSYLHQAYGLTIESDHEIPGLECVEQSASADVRLSFVRENRPPIQRLSNACGPNVFFSPYSETDGEPSVIVIKGSGHYRFYYHDGTEFSVDEAATSVTCNYPSSLTVPDVALYFVGPVLAFILRMRGMVCLHASVIAIEDNAVMFMGAAGTGKSTTAAAFAVEGHAVLTDDVAPLVSAGDEIFVQPAYPRLRLWPDSVQTLFGSADALPLITSNWTKRYLLLADRGFAFRHERLPLRAIYFMDGIEAGSECPVTPVSSADALLILARHAYTGYISDEGMRSREFPVLAQVARTVPLRRIPGGLTTEQVFRRRAAIEADFRTLMRAEQTA